MILFVEHDASEAALVGDALARAGLAHERLDAATTLEARIAADDGVRLALVDLDLPDADALALLARLRRARPGLPILAHSAGASVSRAVAAVRAGADDLLLKPVAPQRLLRAIRGALARAHVAPEAEAADGPESGDFCGLVARSPAIRAAVALLERAAGSEAPILLEGESGVGKEVFARAAHRASRRANGPFVAVNCGALPEALVESILFGHEKGAFTGAVESRIGKFAEADGGVLFLDEVGELPPPAQVKLLRALQERVVDAVGAKRPRPVDIRVISATNRTLRAEVAAGRFREDLYYRLGVLPILVPPLRARREDIAPLAALAVRRLAALEGRPPPRLTREAVAALEAADWPGNVRQLENAVHRAMVLAGDAPLTPAHFDALDAAPAATADARSRAPAEAPAAASVAASVAASDADHVRTLAEIEAEHIRRALERYEGRMTETARRLGIGRSTLYRKMAEYGLAMRTSALVMREAGEEG